MTLRRVLGTAGAIGVCTFALVLSLLARMPDVADVPLVVPEGGLQSMPFTLYETAGPPPPVYVLWLHVDDAAALAQHAEVRILVTAYGNRARVVAAALRVEETPCTYEGRGGVALYDNALLEFTRGAGCTATPARSADLKLSVTLDRRIRFGVWSFLPSPLANVANPPIGVVGPPRQQGRQQAEQPVAYPLLLGQYVDAGAGPAWRRIDLLNHLWQIDASTNWIWIGVTACACLGLVGALLLPFSARAPGPGAPRFTLAATIAMFCLTASLGGLYVLLVPPFQAPDEPDHLLSYARLTGESGLEKDAIEWARLGHFQRLRFHPEERFRPEDVGRPYAVAWDDTVFAEDVGTRSAVTASWWRLLARFLEDVRIERKLLFMRVAHTVLFAICVALATLVLTAASGGETAYPQLLGLVFLLIPTLPFFAMQLSESSVLCSIYVLLAAGVVAQFTDGPRSWIAGAPLGLAIGLTVVSGRSALPMAPLLAAVLLARIVVGARCESVGPSEPAAPSEPAPPPWRGAMTFWLGLASGLALTATLFQPQYAQTVHDPVSTFTADTLYPAMRLLWQPWVVVTLSLVGFGLELGASRLRRAMPAGLEARLGRVARWTCFGVAAIVLGSLGLSLFVQFPRLPLMDVHVPRSAQDYVFAVLSVALPWARIRLPDPLLWTSFWTGFGWLDVTPSEILIDGLTVGAAVLLMMLAIRTGRQRDGRRFVYLALFGCGVLATMVAYAVATYQMHRDLHGRYLIGLYLTALAVTFTPIAWARSEDLRTASNVRATVLLCLAAGIHCYCLQVILARYF